jgi:hypothetical protein
MMKTRNLFASSLAVLLCLALAGPGTAQDDLQTRLDAAMRVFNSADQYDSIALFSELINELESQGSLTDEQRSIVARSYFQRGEVHFNFGENPEAEADIERALRTEPNLSINESMISPKLAELLNDVRSRVVGFLQSSVTPADAVIRVAGAPPLYGGQRIALLEGSYPIRIERPGYAAQEQTLQVPAGQTTTVSTTLDRTSAVLHVLTVAPDLTVLVDGQERGVTVADPSGDESAPASLAVDGLTPGSHTVEITGRGYRPRKVDLDLPAMDDYATDVLALDTMRGTVMLGGLMPNSVVRINGEQRERPRGESASFEIPVGENRIEVDHRGVGRYVKDLEIADGQSIGLEVELRPLVALLGVLGGDEVSARDLQQGVLQFFESSSGWSVADHSDEQARVLAGSGLDVNRFRELSDATKSQIARIDWTKLQKSADDNIGASAYLIAVLSDDLFASSADLWILPGSPHPALPQRVRTDVGGVQVVTRALEPIGKQPTFTRPWLGVRLIETNAADGLVVLNVTDGSPAASAGLKPGDVITSARGTSVNRMAQLDDLLAGMEPHSALQLGVTRPSGDSNVSVVLGSSPLVLPWTDPETFYPLYLGWLAIEEATGQSDMEPWMIQLNRASALMGLGSWEEAIRQLRSIRAPSGGGVGQAMADYWLGMALVRTDPNTYRDIAQQALDRAAGAEGARLYHNDGPLIAPLAEASRKALTGGS